MYDKIRIYKGQKKVFSFEFAVSAFILDFDNLYPVHREEPYFYRLPGFNALLFFLKKLEIENF